MIAASIEEVTILDTLVGWGRNPDTNDTNSMAGEIAAIQEGRMVVPSREREIAMSLAADRAYVAAAMLKQAAQPQANGRSTNHAGQSKPQANIVVPTMMAKITIAVMAMVLLVGAVIWQASFWQGFSDIAQQLVATQGQANQYFEAGREMARRLNKPAA